MDFEAWPIIKWVLIVLLAGFIGHFGKVLAQSVMARMRAKKTGTPPPSFQPPPADREKAPPTAGPPLSPGSESTASSVPVGADQIPDKKMLKALAKQTKKALKKK
ncbi:MAG: hypothetical protein CSYNP_04266 [Syntrophus sp. SKADARSKE-3]|nr:hypothetical protein [Syntrophus sp. SKADARSKE-3]